MKSNKPSVKEPQHSGRFTTTKEAADAKNASLVASLKKLDLKVVVTKPSRKHFANKASPADTWVTPEPEY